MRLSTIKTDKSGEHLSHWDFAKFINRIQTDANNHLISSFRLEGSPEEPERFRRYAEIPCVYAAVDLCRQKNGAIGIDSINRIVVLEVRRLMSDKVCADVKRAAMTMPSTVAAFTGASGTEVVILVSVARPDGSWPNVETEAATFYEQAYYRAANIYDSVLPVKVVRMTPSLRHAFLLPLDAAPLTKEDAVPLLISDADAKQRGCADAEGHLLALPEERNAQEADMTAYQNYERAYGEAADRVWERLRDADMSGSAWYGAFVTGMATLLFEKGWPEGETVCHLWRHFAFKEWPGLTENFVRTLVASTYAQELALRGKQPPASDAEPIMQQLIRRMESRYVFRHNTVMGYPEYRPNHTWVTVWKPVTDKVINTFTTDLQLSGLNVWDRDVKRYVHSTRVRDFNPIGDYLFHSCPKWDGRDYIRELAATVPTNNPSQWVEWFHTWFLAMVAQWLGYNRRFGNAVVPLLVSDQGMHKSAFCRSLLPPELRRWGYTDNLSLAEERPVHLAMAQMLLINLDEFNRISPAKQEGFLKNILQLPSVKVRRPYASHTEDVPRLASFIATTNMTDVLTDPTGSRRFIGVQLTGSIDVSETPNHPQLFAQALAELEGGARYWFDDAETAAIMAHNRSFMVQSEEEMFFRQYFGIPTAEDKAVEWMTATAIILYIKERAGAVFKAPSAHKLGRILRSLPNIRHRHSMKGTEFCVLLKT